MLPQRAAAAVRRAAFGAHLRTKGRGPDARTFTTLGEDVAHRPARGRRSHQPNLGLRPRPLPGGHCSLSTGPPLLAHREIAEILIPQGTKLTLRPAGIAGSPVYHWTPYQVLVAGGDGEAKAQGPSKWRREARYYLDRKSATVLRELRKIPLL